ncbi:acyltransferase family protein [Novosphingobium lentum]|uniref:acyltransferase family protein n=1 Tax=Novosphingobium lentum TaxID=145287 RepID=UPI000831A02A|nr:acyltransferase [Novosphingobium lentum]
MSAEPDRPQPAANRLVSVDAIRGIAALSVVMGHSLEEAIRLLPGSSAVRAGVSAVVVEYCNFGRIGVVAFFLVSGYVIPFSFSHRNPLRSFVIARFFRLYPAYWVSIAGAILIALILGSQRPPPAMIAANITMIQAVLHQPNLIGVYWTLFYELVFYGLCFLAFTAKCLESPRYLLAVVIVLCLLGSLSAGARQAGLAHEPPIGLFVFLAMMHLGTLARLSDRGDGAMATQCYRGGLLIVLLAAGPIVSVGFIQHASNERMIADVTGLYAGLALFLLLRSRPAVATPETRFLGKISYSLYLFHPLCLVIAVAAATRIAAPFDAVFVVLAIPLGAIAVAALVQHLVEAPANRWGKVVRQRVLGA